MLRKAKHFQQLWRPSKRCASLLPGEISNQKAVKLQSCKFRSTLIPESPRTWKTKIKEWGFDKNVSKKDMTFVVAKANQRTMEGKETVFYYRGLEITPSKIKNFRRRQKTTGPSIGSLQDPGKSNSWSSK